MLKKEVNVREKRSRSVSKVRASPATMTLHMFSQIKIKNSQSVEIKSNFPTYLTHSLPSTNPPKLSLQLSRIFLIFLPLKHILILLFIPSSRCRYVQIYLFNRFHKEDTMLWREFGEKEKLVGTQTQRT